MAKAACSEEEFIQLFNSLGAAGTARALGIAVRSVYNRRASIEGRTNTEIKCPFLPGGVLITLEGRGIRIPVTLKDGIAIIGSDGHLWPNRRTCAQRAFTYLAYKLSVQLMIWNGDMLDGAGASRHPRIGWAKVPKISEELEAVEEFSNECIEAAPLECERIWLWGNHDLRFDSLISNQLPALEDVPGTSLKDRFPFWKFGMSAWINDGELVVKHRFKGGIHATHNNTVMSGKSMATGHLHSLKVTAFSDYNGTRYGIDTGTLSVPNDPHADYTEDNPLNHRSGFAVCTFKDGKLIHPELVIAKDENHIEFRGELIRV